MANATITGTASNFGSISGVLAGEAGTVAGTITGTVSGTLTGSVGVPGAGVPSGGTTGQVLKKVSNTDYDTTWGTDLASAAWGTITGTLSSQTDLQTALDGKLSITGGTVSDGSTVIFPSTAAGGTLTAGGSNLLKVVSSASASDFAQLTYSSLLLNDASGNQLYVLPTQINFPDSTVQTTAFIPADYLSKAGNLSGLSDLATSRSNLGLGTMATETASNYLTTSAASSTYLTQANAASTYQTQAGMSSYLTTSAAASTYQTQAGMSSYLTTSAASSTYAPLASPALTGTPTAPTAAAATNTTQIATTAFVQQEVPAASTTAAGKVELATNAEAIATTSTTLVPALATLPAILAKPELRSLAHISLTAISGSGGVSASLVGWGVREMYLGSLATGRGAFLYSNYATQSNLWSRADRTKLDFSKKIWMAGKCSLGFVAGATSYLGDANTMTRITLGGYTTNTTGDMTQKGIGFKKVGGTSSAISLTVHNGTTLTDVATTKTCADGEVIDWVVYSDGTGNVTLFINGTQQATTSAGPTGTTTAGYNTYREQVEATATPGVRGIIQATGGWIYVEG